MGSNLRLLAAIAFALAPAACSSLPSVQPGWTVDDMFGAPAEADAYADFLAARYAGMTDDPVAAARFYRRAFDRAPDDSAALERAVFSTLVEGDVEAAVSVARGADMSVLGSSPFSQLALVIDDIGQGRNARALSRLQAARLGAINEDFGRMLSAWLIAASDVDDGVARATLPEGRRRLGGEHLFVQGLILSSAERDAEALTQFDAAWTLGLRLPLFTAAYVRLLAAQGDAMRAREIVDSYVRQFGATPEVDAVSAMLATSERVKPLRLSTKEGAAAGIYAVSAGALTQTNAELATLYFSLALRLDPDFQLARIHLADALREQDRDEAALDELTRIKKGSSYYAGARIEQGWLHHELGRDQEALAAVRDVMSAPKMGGFERHVRVRAAELYAVLGQSAEADRLFTAVVDEDLKTGARDWRPLFQRAGVRQKLDRWDLAEQDLVLALEFEPDQPDVLNFLGYSWIDRGENVPEGFELIRKAIAERPDAGYIVDSLGWAHYRLGQYEEAVEQLERAVELSPSDAVIADHLGDAYWRADRRIEAGYQWSKALALKPDAALEASLRDKAAGGLPVGRPRISADIDSQRTRQ